MAVIELRNATKTFKHVPVFENLSLQLERRTGYGFVGPNGCGKSVLLKVLCGFSRLDSGQVFCGESELGRDRDFIRDAGVVIETPSFLNELSGYRNLQILAKIRGKIGDEAILQTMETLGLYDERDKKVRAYSLGMRQKLRLAQAMMERPEILVLDEPANGLDKASVQLLYGLLRDFRAAGGLLIMTSHHAADIQACCDVVYEFEQGELRKAAG